MARRKLSDADKRILDVLQADGRIANVALAERVRMSPSPCLRRVKRLVQDGVIKGFAAIVDLKAIGLGVEAFAQVTIERHADAEATAFREAVKDVEEVLSCYAMTGELDFLLRIVVADLEAYGEFVRKTLLQLPSVKDVRTSSSSRSSRPRPAAPWVPFPLPIERRRPAG